MVAVGDRTYPLGIVPPFWAIWRGLWMTFAVMAGLIVAAAFLHPLILGTLWFGIAVIVMLDGATLERIELRLRGWREVGVVEAATEEGAEELYLTGRSA